MGDMFFWDIVINQKQRLLLGDRYKDVIINSWEFLSPYTRISNNSVSTIHLIADTIKKIFRRL